MISEAERSPRDYLVAIWAFLRRALRATRWGVGAFVIGLGLTAVVILAAKRLYRSDTVMMYDRGVRAGAVVGGAEPDSPRQVLIRIQDMLASRQRLQKAIEEFKLYPEIVAQHGYVDAVDEMRKQLKYTARDGYTFHLSYESESRELAQNVLASLASGIIEEDTLSRRRDAESTKAFLDSEKKQADQELKASEAALSSFFVKHPELAAESAAAVEIMFSSWEACSSSAASSAGLAATFSRLSTRMTPPAPADSAASSGCLTKNDDNAASLAFNS
jgi:uncharacterized protein involved in exopolysaccharide biosynthesis